MTNEPKDFTNDPVRARFDELFSEWLKVRAAYTDLKDGPSAAAEERRLSEREPELARAIVALPASQPWMIGRKIEVLRYYLTQEGGTAWEDNREIVMLAGIEADLLRFPPAQEHA
jgi:hypothetical protein